MLEHIDQQLFLILNSLNSPFFDEVMWLISARLTWVPLYLALLIAIGYKFRKKFIIIILFIAVTITISDQATVLLKNTVKRPRPCYEPELEGLVHTVKGRCGGAYGFASGHASNSFAVALLSLLFLRKKWITAGMVIWALIVGYSRIYLGVHYPGDVICGSAIGALTGWGVYILYVKTDRKLLANSKFFGSVKQ